MPKIIAGHQQLRIAITRGDDPRFDGDRRIAPDRNQFAFLQDPQKFYLQARAHLAHFIEEDRSRTCLLENADLVSDGPGEGSFHVAEQF